MTSKEEQIMNSLDEAFGLVLNEMHKIRAQGVAVKMTANSTKLLLELLKCLMRTREDNLMFKCPSCGFNDVYTISDDKVKIVNFCPNCGVRLDTSDDESKTIECPFGGDETNGCADCVYSCDYHFVNGECVLKESKEL